MTSYLLLRSNKESGPYSLDELLHHGLKPYDLVWVTGKSAAWRYPGEITELKEFAPAVEEQPFDRFYKKPEAAKKEEPVIAEQAAVTPKEQPSYIPRKSVFVTMPGQKQQQQVVKKEQPAYPEYQQYQPSAKETAEPVAVSKTITITENPIATEVKYSQPLDEIKEMYVRTLQERKQKIAYKAFLLQLGKKAAVVLAIVAVGVLIGFTIKSNSGKKQPASVNNPQLVVPQQSVIVPSTDTQIDKPAQPTEQTIKEDQAGLIQHTDEPVTNPVITEKQTEEKPVKQDQSLATVPKKNVVVTEQKQVPVDEPSPGVSIDPSTGERGKKVRSGNEETKEISSTAANQPKAVKNTTLSKLVSVKSNEYKKVAFGGIRDLELTVYNDSKYILDNVIVELQYLKPSEQPLKTENIQFKAISPGGSLTVRVPDTNRGIKVAYKITYILSTQSAKDMADL